MINEVKELMNDINAFIVKVNKFNEKNKNNEDITTYKKMERLSFRIKSTLFQQLLKETKFEEYMASEKNRKYYFVTIQDVPVEKMEEVRKFANNLNLKIETE